MTRMRFTLLIIPLLFFGLTCTTIWTKALTSGSCRPQYQSPPSMQYPTTPSSTTGKSTITTTSPTITTKQYTTLHTGPLQRQYHRHLPRRLHQHQHRLLPLPLSQRHRHHQLLLLRRRQYCHLRRRPAIGEQLVRDWRSGCHRQRPQPCPGDLHPGVHRDNRLGCCSLGRDWGATHCRYTYFELGYLSNCSLTFSPNTVYTSGSTMIIGVTPANTLSPGSTVKVQFPRSSWTNDIKAQALPITSSMVCTNYSTVSVSRFRTLTP